MPEENSKKPRFPRRSSISASAQKKTPGGRTRTQGSLIGLLIPYRKRILLAVLFLVMVALFQGLFAIIIQPLMDEIFKISSPGAGTATLPEINPLVEKIRLLIQNLFYSEPKSLTTLLPLMLFFTFFGQAFFNFFSLFLMKTLGLKVIRNVRKKVYSNLIFQSVDYLSRAKTGDLVSRLSNDIDKLRFAISETISVYIREAFTLVILLGVIFYWDWEMALFSLILFPVAGSLLYFFGRMIKRRGIQSQETIGELSSFLSETVIGNKIVKAYNMQNYEINKFSRLNKVHYRINAKIALAYSLAAPVMHTIGGLVAAVIFAVGIHRVENGFLTVGQFTSFLGSLFLMYNPIKRLTGANNQYQQGSAAYHRILEILNQKSDPDLNRGTRALKDVRGRVSFEQVSFSYRPGIKVLDGINLTINPDQVVAIVGPSGVGKSTLMNLLLKFYPLREGRIRIDGQDINDISNHSLRENIGLVTQEVVLFNDTIEKNIVYGSDNYRQEDLVRAAQIARIYDFISGLKDGFQTIVGERGIFLSAGQRQRISIARAVIKNPPILIFDEATSSLDAESEKYIQEAMLDIMRGRTNFVIAHRLSTIIRADLIVVLKDGKIAETGVHQSLLEKKGIYYSLYNLQFP